MSQNEDNESVGSLPRGLITRRGTQNLSTQRLPSLRSESHSSQQLLSSNVTSNSLPITTKGGVLKRTFKPTIPVRRNASEDNTSPQMTDNSNNKKGKQSRSNSKMNNRGNNRGIDQKKLVQMEAAVFNGANSQELKSSRLNESSSLRKRSSLPNESRVRAEVKTEREDKNSEKSSLRIEPKIKLESKAALIRKLYGDNFIDDDNESDEELVLPKGWESVSTHRDHKQSIVEPLNPYNLLNTQNEDKFLLMQIPEAFLKRADGYVGKIRVYKSGRVELEDSESGIKFDILFDNKINVNNVKQENKLSKEINSNQSQDLSQDVVSFSGNDLKVLGVLQHKEVLLAVPQIPLDDHIGPNIPL
jgi:hypothetical protein